MEILQNLESPKWKKILIIEIIVFLILVAGSILLEKYSYEMDFGLLFNGELYVVDYENAEAIKQKAGLD